MISPSSLYGGSYPLGLGTLGSSASPTSPFGASPLATTGLGTPSAASTLGGGIPGAADSGMGGAMQQILSMLMSILSMLLPALMQGLGGGAGQQAPAANDIGNFTPGNAPAPSGGNFASVPPELSNDAATTPPPAAGPAPTNAGEIASGIRNNTADPTQKQRLNTTLGKVAKDPEGAKLLKAAEANGYSIEVGDPGAAGSQDNDADSINGVTVPSQKKIVISPNAPDFDKTVVHELVHAATEADGNSQTEEGMADVIGYRVSSRMNGKQEPGSEQQIFQNKIKSYPNLQGSNDIMNSLSKLGVSA